ncbi:hypothetical protein QML37_31525, partial [Klebsiella pneumoniae]|uniref:hypothetical protein n=1 Tax=Klebsiella pneumoniae TaxID=573 RepID=UPI003A807150
MYAITTEQLSQEPNVIEGTISVANHLARDLFDTGATHSFISYNIVSLINIQPECMGDTLEV